MWWQVALTRCLQEVYGCGETGGYGLAGWSADGLRTPAEPSCRSLGVSWHYSLTPRITPRHGVAYSKASCRRAAWRWSLAMAAMLPHP